jgi:futalosine hydrolase
MEKLKILLISATSFEIAPTLKYLDENFNKKNFFEYQSDRLSIFPLCTGVGLMSTAYAMGKYNKISEMSFALQAGIAGSFSPKLQLGEVVEVSSERVADIGVEEADGSFTDIFELGLSDSNQYPYHKGTLINDDPAFKSGLKKVDSLSVNRVHGTLKSIDKITTKYTAEIENMEGAAFFYACKMQHIKFVEIRAISNYVEKRNKENWDLDSSIKSLNNYLIDLLNRLEENEVY